MVTAYDWMIWGATAWMLCWNAAEWILAYREWRIRRHQRNAMVLLDLLRKREIKCAGPLRLSDVDESLRLLGGGPIKRWWFLLEVRRSLDRLVRHDLAETQTVPEFDEGTFPLDEAGARQWRISVLGFHLLMQHPDLVPVPGVRE